MSAWIVSRAHIDVLVQALCEGEILAGMDPDAVGQRLWYENHVSVNYRYNERTETPEYTYRRPTIKPDPAGVQKAAHCYVYQSCEHDEWEVSEPAHWMRVLLHGLDSTIGKDAWNSDRYPWGYEEAHVHGATV